MGLRYRRSMTLFPGVKLNFGKTGMSVSTGVPGFRKTYHQNGRVTTSMGIPGTGLYYVDTKNPKKEKAQNSSNSQSRRTTSYNAQSEYVEPYEPTPVSYTAPEKRVVETPTETFRPVQVDTESLKSIHKTSDDSIDWTEVLVSEMAPDSSYNQEMWNYYHSIAPKILAGNIDSYLQLIYEVNPLDDLLAFGGNYEFGTDDFKKIEIEFTANENALSNAKSQLGQSEYNLLLQDFICSVCIRIARDMFALLPVSSTIVHAVLDNDTVLSVEFDRATLSKIKFGFIDPSDTMAKFKHNMNFNSNYGFSGVDRIV